MHPILCKSSDKAFNSDRIRTICLYQGGKANTGGRIKVLFVMDRLPNIYNRPRDELRKYRFGFYKRDKSDFRLLRYEDESKPIADLIGAVDFFTYDLCVVPLSQIEPQTDESVTSND